MVDILPSLRPAEQPVKENKPGIPESWFNAYMEGNRLLPQTSIAIDTFVLDAVLRDPPSDWAHFSLSRLSPAQVEKLAKGMTGWHRKAGVRHAYEEYSKLSESPVKETRLINLWRLTVGSVNRIVEGFVRTQPGYSGVSSTYSESIGDFFSSNEGKDFREKLAVGVATASKILRSPEIQSLARRYREARVANDGVTSDWYIEEIQEATRAKATEEDSDEFTREMINVLIV